MTDKREERARSGPIPLGVEASVKAIDESGTWRDQGQIDAVLVRDRSSQPFSQSDV